MASEAGEAGVISTGLAHIADLLLDHGDPILAVGLAGASDRRLRQVGGATTTEMSGLEPPLRGPRGSWTHRRSLVCPATKKP